MGNYFFFMLSGFLIAHSYKDKVSSNEIDFISFIKNRLSKIYPLYIVTNMLALFINICVNGWGNSIRLSGLVKVFLWLQQAGLMMNILIMVHVGL